MPEEIEIETKELQETIEEMKEEREERAREEKENAWTRYIALSTAFLAVIAAVAALQAGKLVNEALLIKNESVLRQAQASDQWAYYQSAGIKSNTAKQTASILSALPGHGKDVETWNKEGARYEGKKDKAMADAKEFEKQRDELAEESKGLVEHHEIFAICVTCTQVAIALSAIAALTRRKGIWYFSMLVGVVGLVLFLNGYVNKAAHPPAKSETPGATKEPAKEPPPSGEKGKVGSLNPEPPFHWKGMDS